MTLETINTSIAQVLKQETKAAHEAIEQNDMMRCLMQNDLSVAHYIAVLEKKYTYYMALEPIIAPYLKNIGFDYEPRKKAHLAYQDLLGLGRQDTAIRNLPTCSNHYLPSITCAAQAIGVLYVLEGSTLGGQMIARHLKQVLPTDLHAHTCFFAGYPKEEVGKMWQEFQKFLVHYAQNHTTEEKFIVSSANETFSTLHTWLMA